MKSSRPGRAGQGERDPAAGVQALYRAMYAVVRRIPRGKVVTYGQLAELAGAPGAARAAGTAMKISTPAMDLPWHRVIGSKGRGVGKVNILDPIGGAMQRAMLEAEGVRFTPAGHIALTDHGWLAGGQPKKRTARRRRRAARS
jgi:methylated-DNA-protein-cysteine methyltransferase related protein